MNNDITLSDVFLSVSRLRLTTDKNFGSKDIDIIFYFLPISVPVLLPAPSCSSIFS